MKIAMFPQLQEPDWEWWAGYFPNGVGSSIFSSPGWQRLMCQEMDSVWRLMILRGIPAKDKVVSIPVFVRRRNWGRVELTVRPIAYYVTPVESGQVDREMLLATLEAVKAPFTSGFTWWLPPWSAWKDAIHPYRRLGAELDLRFGDTYVITLEGSVSEYMATKVSETQNRHVKTSLKNGIEVIDRPEPELVEEYYRLYNQVWTDDKWVGPRFTLPFFRGVAATLGEGGRLVLMRYEGRVVGGGVLLCDHQAVHYYQGAIDREVKRVYPHVMLYKRALELAESCGVRYVNLGGVNPGNVGLIRYKESWGAVRSTVPIIRWRFDGPVVLRKMAVGLRSVVARHPARSGGVADQLRDQNVPPDAMENR